MSFVDRTPRPMPETSPVIADREGADALIDELVGTLGELEALIREETRLARSGLLFAAADLGVEKARVSGAYMRLRTQIKANSMALGRFAPERVEALRRHHLDFNALLRENLSVLAIAREVSEDLVRTVSESVGRRTAPRVYGRDAGTAPSLGGARGIAVDRRL